MPPGLALGLTLIGSNYMHPWLEIVSMDPKVFEPVKFDCSLTQKTAFSVIFTMGMCSLLSWVSPIRTYLTLLQLVSANIMGRPLNDAPPHPHRTPVSILHKSIAGHYRPVRVADGPL